MVVERHAITIVLNARGQITRAVIGYRDSHRLLMGIVLDVALILRDDFLHLIGPRARRIISNGRKRDGAARAARHGFGLHAAAQVAQLEQVFARLYLACITVNGLCANDSRLGFARLIIIHKRCLSIFQRFNDTRFAALLHEHPTRRRLLVHLVLRTSWQVRDGQAFVAMHRYFHLAIGEPPRQIVFPLRVKRHIFTHISKVAHRCPVRIRGTFSVSCGIPTNKLLCKAVETIGGQLVIGVGLVRLLGHSARSAIRIERHGVHRLLLPHPRACGSICGRMRIRKSLRIKRGDGRMVFTNPLARELACRRRRGIRQISYGTIRSLEEGFLS